MEALPVDLSAQLDVVLRLAGMMLHKSNVRPRFVECIQAFTAGIGNGPGATLETLTAHYAEAYHRCYAPFFDRRPHIMENFLINTIVRCRFPFGKETTGAGKLPPLTSGRSARELQGTAARLLEKCTWCTPCRQPRSTSSITPSFLPWLMICWWKPAWKARGEWRFC
jgi:hypothetical protein